MTKAQVATLLKHRNDQWCRYHQLRRTHPVKAAIARRVALRLEEQLVKQGISFTNRA